MPTTTPQNTQNTSITQLKEKLHPVRASNAPDPTTITDQDVYEYSGDVNIFDEHATRIPKVGNIFKPTTVDQVAQLDFQVTRGLVTKTTL